MRVSIFVCSLLISVLSFSQTKLLKPEAFREQEIDQEWVYVKYKNQASIDNSSKKLKSNADAKSPLSNVVKLKVPKGSDPISFCNELRKSSKFEYADPVVQYVPLASPTDALLSNQYYLSNIRAFEGWDITQGDDDIVVGIIDSGIDIDHEDIINNLWTNDDDPIDGIDNDGNGYVDDFLGYDFADEDADPNIDRGNHGMIVGGIAGASTNNGQGIAGVGYNTKIAALKGFRSSNGLSRGLYEAIVYAADQGIDVLNLSWGRVGSPLQSEQDIINYAVLEKDVVIVAAAGNEGGKSTEEEKWYPASYDNVLSVAASDANDFKSSGSTFNHSVDLVAPGVSMFSTVSNNGYADGGAGTSYAAPQVAAAAALVKDQFPSLSSYQIMERLRTTADDIYDIGSNDIYDGKLGKGRLNIYNAVTSSNVKSLRAIDFTSSTSNDGLIFFGDTVQINSSFVSYLSPINDPFVTISSPKDQFTIVSPANELGFLNTDDTTEVEFSIVLNDNLNPESAIDLRLDYSDGSYQDFQFLELETAPEYIDFGNSDMSMTLSSNGNLGFNVYQSLSQGSGFMFQGDTLMRYSGILLAFNDSTVSDNMISDYATLDRDQDFTTQTHFKLMHHPSAEYFGYSEFTDNSHPVLIEQSSYAWSDEDFIILSYRLVNTSESDIDSLSFGMFADWDLVNGLSNRAQYNDSLNYVQVFDNAQTQFAALQVMGNVKTTYSLLDLEDQSGNVADFESNISDTLKYTFVTNAESETAGVNGDGNNVAVLHGKMIEKLPAFGEETIHAILAISTSQEGLQSVLQNAQNLIEEVETKPRVLETLFTCDGSSTVFDLESGTNFELYADPRGETLLAVDSTFTIENITSDTTFFVKNVDLGYPSDLFEIRISLFEDIANFSASTDTLYLDHPTTNVIQFSDNSLDATSWNWNFGNGTSSTLQNPSLNFSEAGTYTVELTVQSSQGCEDSFSKTIVVAERPAAPAIETITACPNSDVTVNDPSADKIKIYALEDQRNPSLVGVNLTVLDVRKDTTIYVSGIYNGFESSRAPLQIDVQEVSGSFEVLPDTTAADNRMLIIAKDVQENASIDWTINGNSEGQEASISIPVSQGILNVLLSITSEEGCEKILQKEVEISTSPFPQESDLTSCNEDSITLSPSNGTYFGFYEDAELTMLIKKGKTLKTNAYSKVYVVGLDDGLPGMPIQVNIANETPEVLIEADVTPVGDNFELMLRASSESDLTNYEWLLNRKFFESDATPTIFIDNGPNEIVLNAWTATGCTSSDTLLLDFTPPPLSVSSEMEFTIYPNPSSSYIQIQGVARIERLEVFQLDGRRVLEKKMTKNLVNLSTLKAGMYLLKAFDEKGEEHSEQIIIN